jgi:hypothetical protein
LADFSLYKQYRTLFKTNILGAQQLLSNSNLNNKFISASDINDATSRLETLEEYYYSNIPGYLTTLLANFNNDIKNLVYKGTYDSSTAYYTNNVVNYNNDLYYCKSPATNKVPTNTTYWLKLGLRGEQGYPTLGINLKGKWKSSASYVEKDVVAYSDRLYVATQSSTNQIPVSTSSYWKLLADYDISKINFSDTNLINGDIYWEELG